VLFAALLIAAAAPADVELLFPAAAESRPPLLAASFLAEGDGGWTPPDAECCWPPDEEEEEPPDGLLPAPPDGDPAPPGLCGWCAGDPPASTEADRKAALQRRSAAPAIPTHATCGAMTAIFDFFFSLLSFVRAKFLELSNHCETAPGRRANTPTRASRREDFFLFLLKCKSD
jgi:hypothetical protein